LFTVRKEGRKEGRKEKEKEKIMLQICSLPSTAIIATNHSSLDY
jgi:hypothetical protein